MFTSNKNKVSKNTPISQVGKTHEEVGLTKLTIRAMDIYFAHICFIYISPSGFVSFFSLKQCSVSLKWECEIPGFIEAIFSNEQFLLLSFPSSSAARSQSLYEPTHSFQHEVPERHTVVKSHSISTVHHGVDAFILNTATPY